MSVKITMSLKMGSYFLEWRKRIGLRNIYYHMRYNFATGHQFQTG